MGRDEMRWDGTGWYEGDGNTRVVIYPYIYIYIYIRTSLSCLSRENAPQTMEKEEDKQEIG